MSPPTEMILYALACSAGHRFESWFQSGHIFEEQAAAGLVACPICASANVRRAIMSPAVVGGRSPAAAAPQATSSEEPRNVALLDEGTRELRSLLRQVKAKLVAEGDDVGRGFAREARRIHEGEAPNRQIYGEASLAEAKGLLEDGIMVLPMPKVPDELN